LFGGAQHAENLFAAGNRIRKFAQGLIDDRSLGRARGAACLAKACSCLGVAVAGIRSSVATILTLAARRTTQRSVALAR
jgi:hypothetical protein